MQRDDQSGFKRLVLRYTATKGCAFFFAIFAQYYCFDLGGGIGGRGGLLMLEQVTLKFFFHKKENGK